MRPQSDSSADRPDSTRPGVSNGGASEGVPPPHLLDAIFRQQLLDHGPALYVANLDGRLIWANAGYRRLSEAAGGTLLPTEGIAAEIALLRRLGLPPDILTHG